LKIYYKRLFKDKLPHLFNIKQHFLDVL